MTWAFSYIRTRVGSCHTFSAGKVGRSRPFVFAPTHHGSISIDHAQIGRVWGPSVSLIEWLCSCWILPQSNLHHDRLTSTSARIYHKLMKLDATAIGISMFHLKLLLYGTMRCCHYKRLVKAHLLASDDTIKKPLNIHPDSKFISSNLTTWLPST